MPYDIRTAGLKALTEASTHSRPEFLPAFGEPGSLEELSAQVAEVFNRVDALIALEDASDYRFPERFIWETLEALNMFPMTHGAALPVTPLRIGHLHGDYSQDGIPLRPLAWDSESWLDLSDAAGSDSFLIDIILIGLTVNSQVNPGSNVALIDELRTELRAGATAAMDTFAEVEAELAELAVQISGKLAASGVAADSAMLGGALPATFHAAENLTGTIDPARIPASVKAAPVVAIDDLDAASGVETMQAALHAQIGAGSVVVVSDGRTLYYKGIGAKDVEASYVVGSDTSPDASQIVGLSALLAAKQNLLSSTADVPGLVTALAAKIDASQKAAANGIASLDAAGKVPASQLSLVQEEFENYAALDAYTGGSSNIWVRGRLTAGDGGQGRWRYMAGNYTTQIAGDALGGMYRLKSGVSAATGAWVRQDMGKVADVLWWGTNGDAGKAAIANASNGWQILFRRGFTYDMTGKTLLPKPGQLLLGGGTLLKTDITTDVASAGAQDACTFIQIHTSNDVTVNGLEFSRTGDPAGRMYAVTTLDAVRPRVLNCKMSGRITPAFFWRGTSRYEFKYNTSYDKGAFGVATGGDGAGNTDGAVLDGQICYNMIFGKASESIDINWDTENLLIEGNILISNCADAAEEEIDIGGGVCRNITVKNNYSDGGGNTLRAILTKGDTQDVWIEGNVFIGGSKLANSAGAQISNDAERNIFIRNNHFRGYCMGFNAAGGIENCEFINNDVGDMGSAQPGRGVQLAGLHPVNATPNKDVRILNNTIAGGTSPNQGIILSESHHCDVRGNRVSGFTADGILLVSTCAHCVVSDNRVTDCDDGIVITAPFTTVEGNRCWLNDKTGFNLTGSDCIVTGNYAWDNAVGGTLDGFRITAGSNRSVIMGNKCYDTRGGGALQKGFNFTGASDRVVFMGNIAHNNVTYQMTGNGALTNSQVANNVTI